MPYIGRNHIAGDHTSNFKVLDDISSYTATFNGSSATIVSTADETIRIPEHRFIQGQRVTYSNGGGGNIGGLTNGTAYFVTFDTANTFKLATSLANANNNTNINLSSVGSGSSHTLTAAFDGVNTIFKITHGGGSSADIANSAQLQIAINNVIQKANLDSSYTEGFLVVDSRKIQFKTAPTADDIFWGNIIANTIETFDISDLKIDQFTGDGTTTQFTLSRDVPNNQSVMVTLDGVVQHPSDKDTTRAYRILADTVIEFSSPPPNPCDVQVRHLGFSGAATGDVSGFYGRTGNVVLGTSDHITTGDITPRNINASGIITASTFSGGFSGNIVGTSATFTGNLSVGGVLTYEDVTNVDSVGIITAQKDIHVGAGVSAVGVGTFGGLDINGDIDVDGHTNLDNVSIAGVSTFAGAIDLNADLDVDGHTNLDNVSIAGVTTFASNAYFGDNDKIIFGSGNRFQIYDNGTSAIIDNSYGGGSILRLGSGNQVVLGSPLSNNQTLIRGVVNGPAELYHAGAKKLETYSSGINVTGNTVADGLVIDGDSDLNGDLDVDGHTNLDNLSIAGVTTFSGDITATGDINANDHINLASGKKLSMAGDVFKIYHSTNAAIINESGDLLINQNVSNKDIKISTGSGPTERLRIDSTGNVSFQPSNLSSSGFSQYMDVHSGHIKKYMAVKNLNSGQGTKFTFTGTDRTSALITIKVAHSWTASNTSNRHGSAIYAVRIFTANGGSAGWDGITLIQAYGYSTSNFILSNESGYGYSIKVNNPLSDSGITTSYDVEIMSASNTSKHTLSSVAIV